MKVEPTSVPSEGVVDQLRLLKSAQLLDAFAEAGYYVPFQVVSGETWPAHQTNYLASIEAIGVAGDVGATLRPAPATGVTRGRVANVYQQMFADTLQRVRFGTTRFRARYWPGTPAERNLRSPRAPMTDFGEGYIDPTRHTLMKHLTTLHAQMRSDLNIETLDWDYFWELRNA